MSIQSWKKEFYDIPASDAAGSDLEAVEHSIKKWKGLTLRNLSKHGLMKERGRQTIKEGVNGEAFWVSASSCALCVKHLAVAIGDEDCGNCPLSEVRGIRCDHMRLHEITSPYGDWMDKSDPGRMIRWLEKAKARVEAEGEDAADGE